VSRAPYRSSSLSADGRGHLRLRYRWQGQHRSIQLAIKDSPEARARWQPLVDIIGRLVQAGRDPTTVLREALAAKPPAPILTSGQPTTLRAYAAAWLEERLPFIRRGQARDYRRHLRRYILPRLGKMPLGALAPTDVRGLQVELLTVGPPHAPPPQRGLASPQRPLKVKTVKNIMNGTLRAMLKAARRDGLVGYEQFTRLFDLEWPRAPLPDADPFTADELERLEAWFARATYKVRWDGRVPWPAYAAFVDLLAWTGMRPSEAAGLQWGDIDLAGARLFVRRSRHLGAYGEPKTRGARRTVELRPETIERLRMLCPLHVTPELPVFLHTDGAPIEPNAFLRHWYAAQRACAVRVRGLYALKDTFVSNALSATPPIPITWLEEQTGVRYATLRQHYARWWPAAVATSPYASFASRRVKLCRPRRSGRHNFSKPPKS
jgi:integrase